MHTYDAYESQYDDGNDGYMMTMTILIKKMMTTKRKQWWHLQSVCADLNNLDLAAQLVHPSHHHDCNDDDGGFDDDDNTQDEHEANNDHNDCR